MRNDFSIHRFAVLTIRLLFAHTHIKRQNKNKYLFHHGSAHCADTILCFVPSTKRMMEFLLFQRRNVYFMRFMNKSVQPVWNEHKITFQQMLIGEREGDTEYIAHFPQHFRIPYFQCTSKCWQTRNKSVRLPAIWPRICLQCVLPLLLSLS